MNSLRQRMLYQTQRIDPRTPSLDHLMMTTTTLILGDFNAHHSSCFSSSTDTRGTMLESMVSGSNFGILNWDSPTRLPGNGNPSSPDVLLALASLITSTNWQTKTNLGSDHPPILISLQMDVTINPIQHRPSINLKKASWDRYSREIEDKLSKTRLPTYCQKGEKILSAIILKAASHHIPSGRHRINAEPVPTEILDLSHLAGFRRFGSHPLSSQSRNQARTLLLALLIGLSRSSVQKRKLWRLSYFQPSTTTCFHPQTNTFPTRTLYHFCFATTEEL